ncbi:unnamed protein product [Adineta ricciae]|uniref:F-box domain-containing protein n=1 Tax=Adineta ricciae TaxID=249248 RepID=A0A814E9U9_ADIRI|nr:unnamed protein product [Adineta ricciae]
MHIESFANELFLEIFHYLTTSNIYYGFHGLNERFDALILEYFRTCDIDFRSISRCDFDFICQHYLPQTINRISSLCLSDGDDTPGQIERFFSIGFKLNQFHNLQSLLLSNIRSCTLINTIIADLPSVPSLIHLTFEQCYFPSVENQQYAEKTTNIIWKLPKLVQLCFKSKYKYRQSHHFVNKYRRDQSISLWPTVTSTTLQRVLIIGLQPCRVPLDQLFSRTPCLQQLILDKYCDSYDPHTTRLTSLTNLMISFHRHDSDRRFRTLLAHLPNLRRLKIDSTQGNISVRCIEDCITRYVPTLQQLQFRLTRNLQNWEYNVGIMNRTLDECRSDFWLVQHRWFVQCDYCPDRFLHTYTLPYAFDSYKMSFPIRSESTYPDIKIPVEQLLDQPLNTDESNLQVYDEVHSLMYKLRFFNMSSEPHIKFHKIQHLSIDFPINDHFWKVVPSLDHLVSLDVLSEDHDNLCQNQLQTLLERSPRLSSIRLCWKTLTSSLRQLFDSRNISVYHLELLCYNGCLKREACQMLNTIIPGIDCKVLNLVVSDRWCILDLVNTLNHLTSLRIYCHKEKAVRCGQPINMNTVEWLKQQLLATFPDIQISKQDDSIRLWIR